MTYDSVASNPMHEGRELPSFSLREVDLPDVEYWEVGKSYYIVMKVEMTGKRNRKDLDSKVDKQRIEGDFQIHSIRPLDDTPINVEALEKADFQRVLVKAKSSGR